MLKDIATPAETYLHTLQVYLRKLGRIAASLLLLGIMASCDSVVDEGAPDIIELASIEDLQEIGNTLPLNGSYVLTNDLDLQGVNWQPIGTWRAVNDEANAGFTGILDGRGHTIRNLTIDRAGGKGVGLFAFVEGGAVENLSLTNFSIEGDERVGSVAGVNTGRIRNVSVSGRIEGGEIVGGVVGANFFVLQRAEAAVEVEATDVAGGIVGANVGDGTVERAAMRGDVRAVRIVGGVIGLNNGGHVSRSYAQGIVSGGERVGGGVGFASAGSRVEEAYAAVEAGGSQARGGLIGENQGALTRTYWDDSLALTGVGVGSEAGATGLATEEMTGSEAEASMNFDFDEIWITLPETYPTLRWIEQSPDED